MSILHPLHNSLCFPGINSAVDGIGGSEEGSVTRAGLREGQLGVMVCIVNDGTKCVIGNENI